MLHHPFSRLGAAPLLALFLCVQPCSLARAEVIQNDRFPVSGQILNDCNGALLNYSGMAHLVTSQTNNPHGGSHYKLHFNVDKFSVVDPATGQEYTSSQEINTSINVPASGTYTETDVMNFRLTSKGSAPNETVKSLFHITVNANGTVTSSVNDFRLVCK